MSPTDQTNLESPSHHGAVWLPVFGHGENPADFSALLEAQMRHYQPATSLETQLVRYIALDVWSLRRCERFCALHQSNLAFSKVLERHKTQAERFVKQAVNRFYRFQKDRLREQKQLELLARNQQRLEQERARLEEFKAREAHLAAVHAQRMKQLQPLTTGTAPSDRLLAVVKPDPASR